MARTTAPSRRSRFGTGDPRSSRNLFSRGLAANAFSHLLGTSVEEVTASRYSSDVDVERAARYLTRTAIDVADTTTPSWAAELVPQVVAEFVALALPSSALLKLRRLANGFIVDLGTRMTVPTRLPSTGAPSAAWIGENGSFPVASPQIGAGALDAFKVGVIAAMSNELLSATNRQAEKAISSVLIEDMNTLLDRSLTDDAAAVAGTRPAGLANGVAAIPSTGNASGDIAALAAALPAAITPVILISPQRLASLWGDLAFGPQLAMGRLGPFALIQTFAMNDPATLIALDASAVAVGIGEPELIAADSATLVMADADGMAPTMAVSATGVIGASNQVIPDGGIRVIGGPSGAGTLGYAARSLLQTYTTALRLAEAVGWTLMRPNAVAVVSGAMW